MADLSLARKRRYSRPCNRAELTGTFILERSVAVRFAASSWCRNPQASRSPVWVRSHWLGGIANAALDRSAARAYFTLAASDALAGVAFGLSSKRTPFFFSGFASRSATVLGCSNVLPLQLCPRIV